MNLLTVVLIGIVAYLVYLMLQSYRSLERELREIRVKCLGTPNSGVADRDPMVTLREKLTNALQAGASATEALQLPKRRV